MSWFRGVITTKATKTAALVVFWDYNELSLADLKKKISLFFYQAKNSLSILYLFLQNWKNEYYSTKQKIFLNILGLPCRFKETNIFIILPSIKELLKYAGSSLQIWRNYCIFIPPSKKTSLNILGVLCRIEEINTFSILTSIKNTHWISWVFFADLKK